MREPLATKPEPILWVLVGSPATSSPQRGPPWRQAVEAGRLPRHPYLPGRRRRADRGPTWANEPLSSSVLQP